VDALFDRLAHGSAFDASHDRQVMHDLLDLAPPGLDEMAAVLNLVGLLGGDSSAARYDIVVVDTAPTGHALRLLELPEVFQGWTKALMSILLKYQPVTGIGELGERLLRLSRGLGRLRAVLQNPTETAFVVVARAAALPREETLRLLSSLRKLRVTVPAVVVNALGRGTCTRCRSIARAERLETGRLGNAVRRRFSRAAVLGAPASAPPPAGPAALEAWRRRWRALA
jgi:arsenite-transporting ATPase